MPVLVLTAIDCAAVAADAIALGAAGYVPKTADKATLLEAIAAVLKGDIYAPPQLASAIRRLRRDRPPREDIAARICSLSWSKIKVLRLLRLGMANRQIARELGICETTVKVHVAEIQHTLHTVNRTQRHSRAGSPSS